MNRYVIVVWQEGGVIDDEVFVGPFRGEARAKRAAERIERAGDARCIRARVRRIEYADTPASLILEWF